MSHENIRPREPLIVGRCELPSRYWPGLLPRPQPQPQAWECPRCKRINAWWLASCKCRPAARG